MTFDWRGMTSSVSVTSSLSFDSLCEPQHGHAVGAEIAVNIRARSSPLYCRRRYRPEILLT